jgi:D-alanyl-D-alanine carboxypeptidase
VRVDVDSRTFVDSSLMGLLPGDTLTLLDLLYGMLLPSGNDAAAQVARTIAGSEQAFIPLMNARAQDLGLIDTHFVNPHGLDASQHYTSAVDLARLTRVALENPTFAKIVQTSARTIRGSRTYTVRNTNRLLPRDDVFGVKTGNTDAAGRCTVVLFRRGGREMIVVVLNSVDRDGVALRLADYAYSLATRAELAGPPMASAAGSGTNQLELSSVN